MTKSIFASKTFWLNLIIGIIAIIGLINPELLTVLGVVNPAQFITIAGVVIAVLNIILRLLTSQPVSLKGDKSVN